LDKALFPLGQCVITPGAQATLDEIGMPPFALLQRHQSGDWGDIDRYDHATNRAAVAQGFRVFSAYEIAGEAVRVWVITEADRSCTTILLPEEY